ncbi:MAG: GT2 family glycosyltransferase/spore maturation protein CgeB [Arenicella sp.]|jgi:GT2 family glycosyltransferase/spore maturation protein CgeB
MYKILQILIAHVKNIIGDGNYLEIRRGLVIGSKPLTRSFSKFKRFIIDATTFLLKRRSVQANQPDKVDSAGHSKFINNGIQIDDGNWLLSVNKLADDVGLSIVTLNLNAEAFLEKYLKGLYRLPNIPIEIIFIDHNSKDSSIELVKKYSALLPFEFNIIQKDFNDRYSTSNNEGWRVAKYDYILFLNNDVVIGDQSQVDVAMRLLDSRDEVGLIGWHLYHDIELNRPQHSGISFAWDKAHNFLRPKNIAGQRAFSVQYCIHEYPAVTAAMLLARKSDLESVGGFDEGYNYGYEDVDLCLQYREKLSKKSVLIDNLSAFHAESTSQNREGRLAVRERRLGNIKYFKEKYGLGLNRKLQSSVFERRNPFSLGRPTIGFVVTEAFDGATAGDYFTALELSIFLKREIDCEIKFFPQRGPNAAKQFSCDGVDLLVVLIDRFDTRGLKDRSPRTMVVAWMRNWFDRWQSWDYSGTYDFYLTSSSFAQKFLLDQFGIASELLRIGTNPTRFHTSADRERDIDICFVGSKWGVERDIEKVFPTLGKYKTHIIGHGWPVDEDPEMFKGGIDYVAVPKVYSNTKVVIDDAASSTNRWASVNSRVFDALAAGCLVITNGVAGANELRDLSKSGVDIPSYQSPQELENLLELYLNDEGLRRSKCLELQSAILEGHSYQNRAASLISYANHWSKTAFKISIKVPVPRESVKNEWGDYHFAVSLKNALQQMGHRIRIDLLPEWYSEASALDEVVIVIRGLSQYRPRENQVNLMWNISHPDKVEIQEYEQYDVVFIASETHAQTLSPLIKNTKVVPLLQCTDPTRFYPDMDESVAAHELLFVGNSRRIYRDVVRLSIENKQPISVYGGLWNGIIDSEYIKGHNIDNTSLRKYYSRAKIVLNDHWESMRELGFISNRIFDVAACGSILVTDKVDGMERIFQQNIVSYDGTSEGFKKALLEASKLKSSQADIDDIVENHSFLARAEVIIREVESVVGKLYLDVDAKY